MNQQGQPLPPDPPQPFTQIGYNILYRTLFGLRMSTYIKHRVELFIFKRTPRSFGSVFYYLKMVVFRIYKALICRLVILLSPHRLLCV